MKVLALDPSSTRCGYALLAGLAADDLVEFGYLTPGAKRTTAIERIEDLVFEVRQLAADAKLTDIVIEISSGKVGRRHAGGGAGLAVYGMAAGAIWAALQCTVCPRVTVHTVIENVWTQGKAKSRRARVLAMLYPRYGAAVSRGQDGGLDAADAIGIGRWFLEERTLSRGEERAA
jgi:Holliday junction resolvasome RuvABC endonuclease subunit